MKPSAGSAATPVCFMPRTPQDPSIRTWSSKSSSARTEIRNLLLFFELEWLKIDDDIASEQHHG